MIPEDIVIKIREQNDIVDVISESGVVLKKSGRNYSGLCPFHNEKTSSFVVSPDKQIFKCFGCGEAGNVVSYIMKKHSLGYVDSLKNLAERVNIIVEESRTINSNFDKYHLINVEAAKFYYNNLIRNNDKLNYFYNRGIELSTIKKFGLGYARDHWKDLIIYLKGKNIKEKDLITLGLASEGKNNSVYNRFRNRVIFPVFDYKGKVIGFGGRVLDDSKPKYLNSPESVVFEKGKHLYGLNFAIKNGILDYIIIVEGYMDVIALYQYGITNVVASLGTALTTNQVRLLKRYVKKVVISYDSDVAGETAALRGLKILKEFNFDINVLRIPKGKDPDEYIRNNGKEAFLKLIDQSESLVDYRVNTLKRKFNINDRNDKLSFFKEFNEILNDIEPIERDILIREIATYSKVSEEAIKEQFISASGYSKPPYNPRGIQEKNNVINQKNNKSYNVENLGNNIERDYVKAERILIKLIIEDVEYAKEILKKISRDEFILDIHREIIAVLKENLTLSAKDKINLIETKLIDEVAFKEMAIIKLENFDYEDFEVQKAIEQCIRNIKLTNLKIKKSEISKKIKVYEKNGDFENAISHTRELQKIDKEIKNIN